MLKRERLRERRRDHGGARRVFGRAGGMSVAVDRDQAFLAAIRRIADEVAAPNADDVDREARFPVETIDALREERALSALIPEEFGGGGVSFEAIAAACFELGRRCGASAMVFAMHQIQIACDRAPPRRGAVVRGLPARRRERAAARRVRHVRGRHRRRHGSIDRRGHAGERRPRHLREAGADRLATAPTPTTCSPRCGGPPMPSRATRSSRSPAGPDHARADRHLGPARDARHLLARLRRPRRVRRRAGPPDPLLGGRDRSRWSRSRTSSGRTCGSASPPTRSTVPAPSCGPRRSASRTRCRRPRCASRIS